MLSRHPWRVRATYLVAIGIVLSVSVFVPRAPILGIWLATACALGAVIALVPDKGGIPGQRILTLLETYAAIVLFSLLGIFIIARSRTEAVQVEYRGVRMSNTDRVVVGVGADSLDISLEGAARGTTPWNIQFTKGDSGWTPRSSHAPEELLISQRPGNAAVRWLAGKLGITFWQPISGTLLRPGGVAQRVVVPPTLHSAEASDTMMLRLVSTDTALVAAVGRLSWVVDERQDSLSYRAREGLRRGRYLSELTPIHAADVLPAADLVRIRRLRAGERVGEPATAASLANAVWERFIASAPGFLVSRGVEERATRFLVSAESPVEILKSSGAAPANAGTRSLRSARQTAEPAEVVARSGADVWRFSWRPEADGALVEFMRRPKKRLLPLTAADACPAGSACNIVSLKRVPPPSPQFLLSEGGLDSSRFQLFGRLTFDENTVWYVSNAARIPVSSAEGGTAIPAERIGVASAGSKARAAIILIARRGSLSASWDVLKVAVGVSCILLCLFGMIRGALAQGKGFSRSIDERPLALALNGLLALAVARLILGTRVTTFPPFAMRGVATAIGLWVSIAIAMVLIVRWRSWYGHVSVWCQSGTRTVARDVARAIKTAKPVSSEDARAVSWSLAALAVALVLLGLSSFDAVFNGIMLGAVIALTWAGLSVAVTTVAPRTSNVALRCLQGPWGVLEATLALDLATAEGRRLMTGMATVLLVCWLAAVSPLAYLIVLGTALAIGVLLQHRSPAVGAVARTGALVGVPIAALSAQSDSHSAAALALALTVGLFVIRGATSIRQGENRRNAAPVARMALVDLFGALLPILLLTPLLLTDVGLFLIVVVPIVLAGHVASSVFRSTMTRKMLAGIVVTIIGTTLAWRLVGLPTDTIMTAQAPEVDAKVRELQKLFGIERFAPLRRSLANVASRGLAASNQQAAERALALSGPGETREYLLRAIEQTWGTKAYAAGGLVGSGLGESPIGGRGIAEAVAYAENSFAVFVLSENGAIGGAALLLCYLLVVIGTLFLLTHRKDLLIGERNHAMRALLVLSLGLLVLPACYVALSNVGSLPITGQNMPFIGLNAWSDVLFCTGILSFFLVAALRLNAEALGNFAPTLETPAASAESAGGAGPSLRSGRQLAGVP